MNLKAFVGSLVSISLLASGVYAAGGAAVKEAPVKGGKAGKKTTVERRATSEGRAAESATKGLDAQGIKGSADVGRTEVRAIEGSIEQGRAATTAKESGDAAARDLVQRTSIDTLRAVGALSLVGACGLKEYALRAGPGSERQSSLVQQVVERIKNPAADLETFLADSGLATPEAALKANNLKTGLADRLADTIAGAPATDTLAVANGAEIMIDALNQAAKEIVNSGRYEIAGGKMIDKIKGEELNAFRKETVLWEAAFQILEKKGIDIEAAKQVREHCRYQFS